MFSKSNRIFNRKIEKNRLHCKKNVNRFTQFRVLLYIQYVKIPEIIFGFLNLFLIEIYFNYFYSIFFNLYKFLKYLFQWAFYNISKSRFRKYIINWKKYFLKLASTNVALIDLTQLQNISTTTTTTTTSTATTSI